MCVFNSGETGTVGVNPHSTVIKYWPLSHYWHERGQSSLEANLNFKFAEVVANGHCPFGGLSCMASNLYQVRPNLPASGISGQTF